MREPMTLLEQSNRQRLYGGRTIRYPPLYTFSNNTNRNDLKSKGHSSEDSETEPLVATGRSIFPHAERHHLDEFTLPSIDKDLNHDENHGRRKRKRPTQRKSNYHAHPSPSSQMELVQLTARGLKPEYQKQMIISKTDDTAMNSHRQPVPPPSPCNDEVDRMLQKPQVRSQFRLLYQKSLKGKDGHTQSHLPPINISSLSSYNIANMSSKDIRSTLSHYLQQYY